MMFDLPFESDFKRVFVKARVVRSIILGDKDKMGIAFDFQEFAKGSQQVLASYIELRESRIL